MKIYKKFLLLFVCFVLLVSSYGCKSDKSNSSELVIGVEDINRAYDPFYISSEADLKISSQIFQTVQRKDSSNSFVDYCGGISYEIIDETQVLYTVTLKEDMFFSNGKNVTVDDLIFFYHYIADASYDGYYSDWYLNDIVGLKEYYYDDVVYLTELESINYDISANYTLENISDEDFITYLVETDIGGIFSGKDVEISEDYIEYIDLYGFTEAYNDLGDSPSREDVLTLIASVENEYNRSAYDPESWYRETLLNEYIANNYENGTDVTEISGIKKINDYSCTILFNSRNINAVSEINVPLVCKDDYIVDYVKGNTDEIKDKKIKPCGSGPYMFSKEEDDTVKLIQNKNYYDTKPEFTSLKFVDYEDSKDSLVDALENGEVDIITVSASESGVSGLDSDDFHAVYFNDSYYTSLFFNSRTLDITVRQALAGLCNFTDYMQDEYGNRYTRLNSPVSIRFAEYPHDITEPYYSETSFSAYSKLTDNPITSLTAYYCGDKDTFEYGILSEYQQILADEGISLAIVITTQEEVENAIINGEADLWIENVYDGATCDKYDYCNSQGLMNKTGLNDIEIDVLTMNLRSAVGFSDKSKIVSQITELVMAQAVEIPICQTQSVTVYSYNKISADSFDFDFAYDDFVYTIPELKQK